METGTRISRTRRIIGDVLIAAVILLIADVLTVTLQKINTAVLKSDYQEVGVGGRILSCILIRKWANGGFIISPDGIRNTFAPSFLMGERDRGYAFKTCGSE